MEPIRKQDKEVVLNEREGRSHSQRFLDVGWGERIVRDPESGAVGGDEESDCGEEFGKSKVVCVEVELSVSGCWDKESEKEDRQKSAWTL
jgi:hypothetical protein